MENSEIEALPEDLRAFVLKIGAEKRVPFDCVLGAVFDGCTRQQIESFDSDRFARFTRRSYVPRAPLKRKPVEYGYSVPVNRQSGSQR